MLKAQDRQARERRERQDRPGEVEVRTGREAATGAGGEVERPHAGGPFNLMRRFAEEMDRLFEEFASGRGLARIGRAGRELFGGGGGPGGQFWSPDIEVFERGGRLVVRADLPGLSREGVQVVVEGDQLIVKGERHQEHEEKKEGYYRSERSYGSFYRSVPLPQGIDTEAVNATFKDGVLEVDFPAPPRKETGGRRVEIR